MDTSLETLIARCQAGDELAWEALVRQTQARVVGLAYHYVGQRDDARDLAQEIFVRVYRALPGFHTGESFLPWLLRIARNASIDHLRRRKARPPAQDLPADEMWSLADPGPAPDAGAERALSVRLLHRALDAMNQMHREIILLKDIQGLTLEEIAGMLDLPLGTVKSRSNRARRELARTLVRLREEGGLA